MLYGMIMISVKALRDSKSITESTADKERTQKISPNTRFVTFYVSHTYICGCINKQRTHDRM